MEQPSYWAVLPAKVRYATDLSEFQKLLFAEITALSNKYGYCTAGNEYFAGLYGKGKDRISKSINDLYAKGYVSIFVEKKKGNIRKIVAQDLDRLKEDILGGGIVENSNRYSRKLQYPYSTFLQHNNTSNNTIIEYIFSHRNSKNIIVHKKLSKDTAFQINKRLVEYSQEELVKAIDNYAEIYHSSATIIDYRRTLAEFMSRKNGMPVFLEKTVDDYLKKDFGNTTTENKELQFRQGRCSPEVIEWLYTLPEVERLGLAKHLNQKKKTFGDRQDERFKEERIKSIHQHLFQQQNAA